MLCVESHPTLEVQPARHPCRRLEARDSCTRLEALESGESLVPAAFMHAKWNARVFTLWTLGAGPDGESSCKFLNVSLKT